MALPSDDIEGRVKAFQDFCQSRGFKATPQRLEIFRQVARTDEHPEADVVCARVRKRMPTVSPDTIYRTLAFLEQNGLIRKLSRLHGASRFDANVEKHHHFVCTECGGAWDVYSETLDHLTAPPEAARLGAVTSIHTELHGVCTACQAAKAKARSHRSKRHEPREQVPRHG
jgi:Fur family transcriptional regulator, peroxide stress response regulator